MLFDCKIIPYVVCSGATESRKVDTLMERMKARINRIIQLDGRTEEDEPIYPLFIGEVFRDVLKKLNVKMVVCDFEADLEAANIAKQLDAPVLSLDSDFYIFDVKYIPFSHQHGEKIPNLSVDVKRRSENDEPEFILGCKIFNREKFLRKTGLKKDMLPVLTVFLGNDFIERVRDIRRFFQYLQINSQSRDFIANIIGWLKDQNPRSAIEALLRFYNRDEQEILNAKIEETIKGYSCCNSKFLKYLISSDSDEQFGDSDEYASQFPKHFLDKYRRGLFQHNFMEILLNHRYFPKPLVEEITREHSYKKSYEIVSALHKILTNSSRENFVVFARLGTHIIKEVVPTYKKELPSFEQIQEMNVDDRKKLLLEILHIDRGFSENCLDIFEDSWKILLITLKYLSRISNVSYTFMYSLILCKIIVTYIDTNIGQIRSKDELYQCCPRPRRQLLYKDIRMKTFAKLSDSTKEITTDDCAIVMEALLPFFWMEDELKFNSRLFDRNLLHLMSEFQACLLHINFLNALLDSPYQKCFVWECFNGTFVYNLTNDLNRKDLNFVPFLLRKSPSIFNCFDFVINNLKANVNAR